MLMMLAPGVRKTQENAVKTDKNVFARCKLRLGPKAVPKTQDTPDDAEMGARVSANPIS